MSFGELLPNINVTESTKRDNRSILFLKMFLPDSLVDCRQLQAGGTLPNIDGYIDILCPDGTAREKIVVQVKHLTYPEADGDAYYDIPQSIYAYAERHKGELVFFIACDYDNRRFYWRNIDVAAIEEFKNKSDHIQTKARYHFKDSEKCSETNVEATIELWRRLYKQKMESIRDERRMADLFALRQRMYFNSVSSELHGVRDSHIARHQVDEIMQWVGKATDEQEKNICLLVGDAGVGKSAVLKDLIFILSQAGIKYLSVKADSIDDNGNPVSLEEIRDALAYYSAEADKVILIIDQIDALSQSLANDRAHLNMMMAVLSSLDDWPNVRAVVSCRKYDLEYDAVLNGLKDKSTVIEIGELTEDEVTTALEKLEAGLGEKVDRVTAKVLRTVHMLDAFSFVFQRNKSRINYNSRIELYDAVWDTVICDSSSRNDIDLREHLMYKIAETIRIAGTLSPQFTPVSSQKQAYEYLASNGLIRRERSSVSFFHQSFYEYTLARHYSETGNLFVTDIKKEIQGLEVRSMVKAVLDFKRGHDILKFEEEARSILQDPDIRFHLKLLTLSVLAFVGEPSRKEKKLIEDICQKDGRMLGYFLRGVSSSNWFPAVRKLLNCIMPGLKKNDNLFFPIISCLSRYAFNNPDEVYGLIDRINDQESRLFALAYTIREHNDYSKPCVLKVYAETKPENTLFVVSLIQDAVKSNSRFALDETKGLISDYLKSDESFRIQNEYELTEILFPMLCAEYPGEMLEILHECICKSVCSAVQAEYWFYSATGVLKRIASDKFTGTIFKRYEDLLVLYSSDETTARPLIVELLSMDNVFTLSMAFGTMSASPVLYDDLIRSFLSENDKIGRYLHGDVAFFFMKMLRAWYNTLNESGTEWYQSLLLSYKSELDFKYDAERKWSRFLCPHLWKEKWMLICNTLPVDSMIPAMKKCSQELMRRFGKRYTIERPDHSASAAYYCGGVVGDTIYSRWPISNWMSSFLKLDEHKWLSGRKPISLSVHADAFKKCVAANPEKFRNFILDISSRIDIPDMYKVAGLEGLLSGGVCPDSLWHLAKHYITEEYARQDSYSFGQIAEYYIKEESKRIDVIIKLCKAMAISPFLENKNQFDEEDSLNDISRRATYMLSKGINSYQGRAAELLVHVCAIPSRRSEIYRYFTENSSLLHECVKMIPLHYLNVEGYFDEELYFPMMQALLSAVGTEALYIQPNVIQWSFYHKNDMIINYIDRIELDVSSHELLAQIYFYGMAGPNNPGECAKRLEKILSFNNENVVATIVETAMKSYNDAEYRDMSIKYLERFTSDNRDKVIDAYCLHCESLPVDAFGWYCGIVRMLKGKTHQQIFYQLEYVKRCITIYPVLCYHFISSQINPDAGDAFRVDDEVVMILLEIYKKLRFDEDTQSMNELLDLFDEYIYQDNRVMKSALSQLR